MTRDRLMVGLHDEWPAYDFATHKGYITAEHEAALAAHGPSPVHRMRFVNVRRAAGLEPALDPRWVRPLVWGSSPERPDGRRRHDGGGRMSAEDLEKYETEMELTLYREYRDVVGIFKYVVETDRRFYLCNQVDVKARSESGDVFFEVSMTDAWVWDMYRPARFAKNVKVLTFKDVNVEELRPRRSTRPRTDLRTRATNRPQATSCSRCPQLRAGAPRRCRCPLCAGAFPICPTGRHPRWPAPLPPHPSPPTLPPSTGACWASAARPSPRVT